MRNPTREQLHVNHCSTNNCVNSNCHDSVDLDLKRFPKNDLIGSFLCVIVVAIMIYDQDSKIFKKFLRPLTMEELVIKAAELHACKHPHPVLNERQAAQFFGLEATRRLKIEKKQWSSWVNEKPQLYMEAYDLRQQRMAQTLIKGQPVQGASGDNEVANNPDHHEQLGAFWQLSEEDRKQKILKGKRILREHSEARLMAECGTSSIRPEPGSASSSVSTFQWLPDPRSSTLHEAGAPTGTPFLGDAAEIETSVNSGGWNWRDMPGKTNDEKWFHFVYRKPLRGYENEPFFTEEAADGEQRGNPKVPM